MMAAVDGAEVVNGKPEYRDGHVLGETTIKHDYYKQYLQKQEWIDAGLCTELFDARAKANRRNTILADDTPRSAPGAKSTEEQLEDLRENAWRHEVETPPLNARSLSTPAQEQERPMTQEELLPSPIRSGTPHAAFPTTNARGATPTSEAVDNSMMSCSDDGTPCGMSPSSNGSLGFVDVNDTRARTGSDVNWGAFRPSLLRSIQRPEILDGMRRQRVHEYIAEARRRRSSASGHSEAQQSRAQLLSENQRHPTRAGGRPASASLTSSCSISARGSGVQQNNRPAADTQQFGLTVTGSRRRPASAHPTSSRARGHLDNGATGGELIAMTRQPGQQQTRPPVWTRPRSATPTVSTQRSRPPFHDRSDANNRSDIQNNGMGSAMRAAAAPGAMANHRRDPTRQYIKTKGRPKSAPGRGGSSRSTRRGRAAPHITAKEREEARRRRAAAQYTLLGLRHELRRVEAQLNQVDQTLHEAPTHHPARDSHYHRTRARDARSALGASSASRKRGHVHQHGRQDQSRGNARRGHRFQTGVTQHQQATGPHSHARKIKSPPAQRSHLPLERPLSPSGYSDPNVITLSNSARDYYRSQTSSPLISCSGHMA